MGFEGFPQKGDVLLLQDLDEFLEHPRDRELFDLPKMPWNPL